jgi:hypothetical protein
MKHLKGLALALTLMAALSVTSFAGETQSPPCIPGETASPPCASQAVNDDSADPGETLTPPAVPAVDVTDAVEGVLWVLSLF